MRHIRLVSQQPARALDAPAPEVKIVLFSDIYTVMTNYVIAVESDLGATALDIQNFVVGIFDAILPVFENKDPQNPDPNVPPIFGGGTNV